MDATKRLVKLDLDTMRNYGPSRVFKQAVNASSSTSSAGQHESSGPPQLTSVAFDHSGELCLTSGEDETFALWSVPQATKKQVFYSKKYGVDLARFTHSDRNIIHASTKANDHTVRYHSAHDNKYLAYYRGHMGRVRSLQMSPANDTFLSAGDDGSVRMWDLRGDECTGLLNDMGGPVVAAFDNTGQVFAVAASHNATIMLYNTAMLDAGSFSHASLIDELLANISQPPPRPVFTSISFSNNGLYLLVTTSSDTHYVLDAFECQLLRRLVGHAGLEQDRQGNKSIIPRRGSSGEEACWTSDSRWVISGSATGEIIMWDLGPPGDQDKVKPAASASDSILRPSVILPGRGRATSRVVRANPRSAMMAVGGDDLSFWIPSSDESAKMEAQGY